jgi:pimeloyl-ACP methyl ester carboxylesterase
VRFDFRGHGRSSVPDPGAFRFVDFARDLDAVATAYGATRAIGTSLGAGAITNLVAREPERFDKLVLLLPAALDVRLADHSWFDRIAELLETLDRDEAIETILAEGGREGAYAEAPWLRELDLLLWQDMNPVGVARAIREVVRDVAVPDQEALRAVEAPTLIIARAGDAIHPVELARILVMLMPNARMVLLANERELLEAIPSLVEQVRAFLAEPA